MVMIYKKKQIPMKLQAVRLFGFYRYKNYSVFVYLFFNKSNNTEKRYYS